MTQRTLIRKIGECLSEDGSNIKLETELDSLEGWDSVGRLLISTLLAQYFKKDVGGELLVSCRTVGEIVVFVRDSLEK